MTRPLLSIVIPTYTRAPMLLETLTSIESQSSLPLDKLEIIVSNDCSKDNTKEVLEKFSVKHADWNFKVFHQEKNLKGPGNWKFCLEAASGEFVFLLSDDDLIDPGFIESYIPILENETDIDIVFSGMKFCDAHMQVLHTIELTHHHGSHSGAEAVKQQMQAHHMVMSSIYRRELFLEAGGWNGRYGVHIDCAAFCNMAIRARKVFYIDRPLFLYRVLADSWASFSVEKQKIQYECYRLKIDDLIAFARESKPDLLEFLSTQYEHHANCEMQGLEMKYAFGNISGSDLRKVVCDIIEIFPEARSGKTQMKLNLISVFGVWWLRALRKLLNRADPYLVESSVFETCK